MVRRNILQDCCEDWLIDWGPFQQVGDAVPCPECGTPWQKLAAGRFRRPADSRTFAQEARQGDGGREFPYLVAEDGEDPVLDRCCVKLILRYGLDSRGPLTCPICRVRWRKDTATRHGIRTTVYQAETLAEPYAIQEGRTRSYLIPLSSYAPPRE